ncbi:hypothetical protein M885DRAFT_546769 [Pelagophyceae sp. CCMP2097]|nr:hypothetical protein M885DRAFT_546769 [Pelagophyceae sp. CCMP2097]
MPFHRGRACATTYAAYPGTADATGRTSCAPAVSTGGHACSGGRPSGRAATVRVRSKQRWSSKSALTFPAPRPYLRHSAQPWSCRSTKSTHARMKSSGRHENARSASARHSKYSTAKPLSADEAIHAGFDRGDTPLRRLSCDSYMARGARRRPRRPQDPGARRAARIKT